MPSPFALSERTGALPGRDLFRRSCSSRVPHAPCAHPGRPSRRPDEPMSGEPLKTAVRGSIWMLQGGLGTPEYFVLPNDPSGVPPAEPQRGAARVQTPSSCLFAATANGRIRQRARRSSRRQARGRYWGVWAERGRGKRTPAITSPLSFDLTGVRFQRRARLARGRRTRRAHQRITRQPQRDD